MELRDDSMIKSWRDGFPVYAEDPNSVLSTHVWQLKVPCNSRSKGSSNACKCICTHMHTPTHIDINKTK